MGGELTVSSELEVGSCFTMSCIVEQSTAQEPSADHSTDAGKQAEFEQLGLSILIAEDNEINQLLIKSLVEKMGCRCELAINGHEVLNSLQKNPDYDLILMDCLMPDMDGYQATQAIRNGSLRADIRIVAVTANSLADDQQKCLDAGMDAYITKPIDVNALYAALKSTKDMLDEKS
jgi:CheY-like chemotaxis protein